MARGGSRQGTPGTAYPNRTDLQRPGPLPAQVGPSTEYGQAAASIRAQQAIPMASPGVPAPPPPAAAVPPPSATPAAPAVLPGQLPDLARPSERPHEPVSAGAPLGPGPGVEALGADAGRVSDLIAAAAAAAGDQSLAFLANRARTLGQ